LIDACQCDGSRVIDLYASVFRKLAPLSAGLVRVRVAFLADHDVVLPATDMKGDSE
jgi:rare lipoprotein A (peptidoglycan hydrolase)